MRSNASSNPHVGGNTIQTAYAATAASGTVRVRIRKATSAALVSFGIVTSHAAHRPHAISALASAGSTARTGVFRPMVIGASTATVVVTPAKAFRSTRVATATLSATLVAKQAFRSSPSAVSRSVGFTILTSAGAALRPRAIGGATGASTVSSRRILRSASAADCASFGTLRAGYAYRRVASGLSVGVGAVLPRSQQRITLSSGAVTQSMVARPVPVLCPSAIGFTTGASTISNTKTQTITGCWPSRARPRVVVVGRSAKRVTVASSAARVVTLRKGVHTPTVL